ncbi:phosphotransferase family protein [Nocardioides sp. BP30]|uniref:phosphotransferase family protein n=1 Tax=Nocardioides sp. BP30 TaxID=3036374 RepID=UPI00246947AC|nr:phosphotransferase family protein [Nocardioides sp. BP30]WGL54006.1 phosphotransferase family protein [Nocardioides sp. BP30]
MRIEHGESEAMLAERVARSVARWHPEERLLEVSPLTGGASSLTYRVRLADSAPVVLKVAPAGLPPVRNRDVLRQARLLEALEGTAVKVPRALFADAGEPPAVPPYFAMDWVEGECVEPVLVAADERPPAADVRRRALSAAAELAVLHAVDPQTIGLSDEPVVTLEEEIDRWARAFETVPADLQGRNLAAAAALRASVPAAMAPAITHGDYRLGNTLCSEGVVTAIIDWEIWSLGDPRLDVTWLTYFTDEAAHPAASPDGPVGTPSRSDLIAAYSAAAGHALADMDWFDTLATYKEAAATALLLKRARSGGALPAPMARMAGAITLMVEDVIRRLG